MPARNILFLLFAGTVLFIGCSQAVENADKKAPDFSLQDINNNTIALSNYEGEVIILNFFATWCAPCRIEIPDFIELANEYSDRDFAIIGISLDRGNIDTVRDFVDKYNINYPILFDDGIVSNTYGPIHSIPTTFIIDKKGNIVQTIIGSRRKDFFEDVIKPLL